MDDAVPRKARVIDDDVNLPVAELRRLLHQRVDVRAVQHIAGYGDCGAAGFLDRFGYCFCFLCVGKIIVSGEISMGRYLVYVDCSRASMS